jgi:hypothetical protein
MRCRHRGLTGADAHVEELKVSMEKLRDGMGLEYHLVSCRSVDGDQNGLQGLSPSDQINDLLDSDQMPYFNGP